MTLDPTLSLQAGQGVTPLAQPMDLMGKAMSLQGGMLQLQQQKMAMQDEQTMRRLASTGQYKTPGELADAAAEAGVSPKTVMALKMQGADYQSKVASTAQALATAAQRGGAAQKTKIDLINEQAQKARALALTAPDQASYQAGLAQLDQQYAQLGVPSLLQKYGNDTPANRALLATNGATLNDAHAAAFGQNVSGPAGVMNIKTPIAGGQPIVTQLAGGQPHAGIGPDGKTGFFQLDEQGKVPAGWKPIPPNAMNVQINPGGHTDSTQFSSRAQQIADGEVQVPRPNRGDPSALQDVADAKRIMQARGEDPINLNGKYAVVHQGQISFAPGKPNANTISAVNTAADHTNNILIPAAKALNNGDFTAANALMNKVGVAFGKNEATNFDSVATFLATEVAKVANGGTTPTLSEIAEARKMFPTNGSNAQIMGAVDIANRIMRGKLNAVEQQHENAYGGKSITDRNLLTPEAISIFGKFGKSSVTPPPTPSAPKLGTVDNGYVFLGGDPSNPKSWKKQ